MYERFSDRARKVMQLANQEAQRFNHEYIGTEHILMGLAKEGSGVAVHVLDKFDIGPVMIRTEVEKLVQRGPDMITMGKLPQTPRAKKVIEYAMEEARLLAHNYVGTEHILLGLIRENEGVAAHVLRNLGIDLDKTKAAIHNLLSDDKPPSDDKSLSKKGVSKDEIEAQVKLQVIKHKLIAMARLLNDVLNDLK